MLFEKSSTYPGTTDIQNQETELAQVEETVQDEVSTPDPSVSTPAPSGTPVDAPQPSIVSNTEREDMQAVIKELTRVQELYKEALKREHANARNRKGEVGKLQEENASLRNELSALRAKLDSLVPESGDPRHLATQYGLSDEETDAIGQDTLRAVAKIARGEATRNAPQPPQEQPPARSTETPANTPELTPDEEVFFGYLSDATIGVPDWDAIGKSPEFAEWLDSQGLQDTLAGALSRLNAKGVVDILRNFKKAMAALQPPATPPQSKAPNRAVEMQAAPRTAAAAPKAQGPRIIPKAEYDAFYDRLMKVSVKTADDVAKDKEYTRAMNEGRVRG